MSLGSIVVRLTMNTADFETDAGRAAKTAERRAKEIDAAFRKAGIAIGLALGTGLALGAKAIKDTVDRMDDLSKAAQRVQMPTEDFSRLTYAGGLADVQMETIVSTFGKLTKAQAAALDGTSDQAKIFDALGIKLRDTEGKLRSGKDILLDFADVFAQNREAPELMAAGMALFGRSFQEIIPLIKDGSGAIRDAMKEADDLGITLSTETGKAAEEFNDNLTRLQTGIQGVWMEIASGMLPQLVDMTGELVTASKETDNLRQFGSGLISIIEGIGSAFGFVSGMAHQFGIDIATANERLLGFREAAMNVATLGLADGSVSGGLDRAGRALDTRRDMMASEAAKKRLAQAQASLQRTVAGLTYAEYSGPLLAGLEGPKADTNADILKRIRDAYGPTARGGSKGSKSRAAELTDEQKALKALNDEYQRELTGMKERLGLLGLTTEAARTQWEVDNGRFRDLDPMQKAALVAEAALYDAKQKALDLEEEQRRAREAAQEGYQRAIDDIRSEAETLGMTNEQLEIYNRLKFAGAGITDAMRQSIVAETEMLQEQRRIMGDQIFLMDGVRDASRGVLQDWAHGAGLLEGLRNGILDLTDALIDLASRRLIEQIFGQNGSASGGSFGGGLISLFGSLFGSMFGGGASAASSGGQFGWAGAGYARGGWTGPGGENDPAGIVHRDEVVWSKNDVSRAGGVGAVEAMRRGGAASSSRRPQRLVIVDDKRQGEAILRTAAFEDAVMVAVERNAGKIREAVTS